MPKEPKLTEIETLSKTSSSTSSITNIAVISLIVGALAFLGGMKFKDYQIEKQRQGLGGGQFVQRGMGIGANGQNRGNMIRFAGGGGVFGEVISIDDKSMTIKSEDGGSKIVFFSDKTTYNKSDQGSKTDLKAGVTVAVIGQPNPDGTVNAQNVSINPMVRPTSNEEGPTEK